VTAERVREEVLDRLFAHKGPIDRHQQGIVGTISHPLLNVAALHRAHVCLKDLLGCT
jgi:hypothetical protein